MLSPVHRSNNQNRDATPGQKAMATAMAFPEPKRGMHSELIGSTGRGYDKAALSRARFVLRNNPTAPKSQFPQYALDVMAGRMTLTEAYDATGGRTWVETGLQIGFSKILEKVRRHVLAEHGLKHCGTLASRN